MVVTYFLWNIGSMWEKVHLKKSVTAKVCIIVHLQYDWNILGGFYPNKIAQRLFLGHLSQMFR